MASRARRETTLPRGGVYATIVGSVSARQPVIPARPSSMGAALRKGGRHLTQLSSWAKLKGGSPSESWRGHRMAHAQQPPDGSCD